MVRVDLRGRDSDKPPSMGGRLGVSLFFFFFFAMGSLFEILIIREFGRALGQRSWKKVPCTIVRSVVEERNGSEEPYAFGVRYTYEYGGQAYTGSTYKRSYSGSDKYSGAQQLARKYPAGQNNFCYVNSARPGQAVLKRDSLAIGLAIFFPLIFVAIGAGGIYFIWKKQPPEAARPIAATAIREKQIKGKGKYGLAALFLLFTAVGGGMLYPLGIRPIARTIAARSWVTTPCTVLRAEVRSHDSDDGTTYSVYILYQYRFDGQVYKSDRYDFIGGSSSGYRGKARVVAEYEAAANPVCYVNPDEPTEAVLKRGFHAKLLLALFPLPFLLIGICGLVHTRRGGKPSAIAKSRDLGIPIGPVGPTGPVSSPRSFATPGSVVLTPKVSAKAKFIGVVFFAAFWNGIVSIFVSGVIDDLRHGDPSWLTMLFLLPFVAVGIGLIGAVVYCFLALFNPRPALELSSGVVPLGGAAELRWRFTGRTNRIGEFTVTLRGIEEARYRRGTSTYTDKNTFYEMELYRASDTNEIATGQVGFVMPADTMHSFEAENNKIIWNLDIHGAIKGWPDVKESFAVNVVPGTA